MTTYIITDSSACMTQELLAQNPNIKVVPFTITYPDGTWEHDLPDMDRSKLYSALKGPKFNYFGKLRYRPDLPDKLPGTTQPNVAEFSEVFETLSPADNAFCITISGKGKLSGSFNSAYQAAQHFSNVEAIDSLSASMGQGWIVLELAKIAREKNEAGSTLTLEEAKSTASDIRSRMILLQTMTTLRYLERGGRIGKAKRYAAELTGTLPIITLDHNGAVIPAGSAKDKKAMLLAAFTEMVEIAAQKVGQKNFRVAFTHGEVINGATGVCNLVNMVQSRFPNQILGEPIITDQACVLYPYTGPDTFGMMLVLE